jgi:hypothetical protein
LQIIIDKHIIGEKTGKVSVVSYEQTRQALAGFSVNGHRKIKEGSVSPLLSLKL